MTHSLLKRTSGPLNFLEEAAIKSGLQPHKLLTIEEERFGSWNRTEYLERRNFILSKWVKDVTTFLPYKPSFDREIYDFLYKFGIINFGLLKERPNPLNKNRRVIVIGAGTVIIYLTSRNGGSVCSASARGFWLSSANFRGT